MHNRRCFDIQGNRTIAVNSKMKTFQLCFAVLLLVTVSHAVLPSTDACNDRTVCETQLQVKCTGAPTAAENCPAGTVFKKDGALCKCCNACYIQTVIGGNCRAQPAQARYYACPDGAKCNYFGYCQ